MKRAHYAGLILLSLAACQKSDDTDITATTAPGNFVPPVTQAPDPVAGQRNATPLTNYVGKYPRDAVGGVTFFDRTEVANALIEAVPEEPVRHMIVGRDVTQVPIFERGGMVAAHGCTPHDCAARNWTVMVPINGDVEAAQVCYHDAASMQDSSRWSTRRDMVRRPGACPQA